MYFKFCFTVKTNMKLKGLGCLIHLFAFILRRLLYQWMKKTDRRSWKSITGQTFIGVWHRCVCKLMLCSHTVRWTLYGLSERDFFFGSSYAYNRILYLGSSGTGCRPYQKIGDPRSRFIILSQQPCRFSQVSLCAFLLP